MEKLKEQLKDAIDNGAEPAFSRPHTEYGSSQIGLTKREWIAGMALQGFLASYAGAESSPYPENAAIKAIQYADELLYQLEGYGN